MFDSLTMNGRACDRFAGESQAAPCCPSRSEGQGALDEACMACGNLPLGAGDQKGYCGVPFDLRHFFDTSESVKK
mgnify:CR=1 FL=1